MEADQSVPVKNPTGSTSRKNSSVSNARTRTIPAVVATPRIAASRSRVSITRSVGGRRRVRSIGPAVIWQAADGGGPVVLRGLEGRVREGDVAHFRRERAGVLEVEVDEGLELRALGGLVHVGVDEQRPAERTVAPIVDRLVARPDAA